MIQAEEQPIKHTAGAEIPDTSRASEMTRRLEADLPLLSDPEVIRAISTAVGLTVLGAGLLIYLFRRSR